MNQIENKKNDTEKPTETNSNDAPTARQIIERYAKEVEWRGETRGRCRCPGQHRHSTKSHRNDCWIFLDGVPTLTCLHQSCENDVAEANSKIRAAWSLFQPEISPEELAIAKEKAAKRHNLEERARASLPEVLKQHAWSIDEILSEGLSPKFEDQSHIFLSMMFKPEDTIWIGEPDSTGQEKHRDNFRPRSKWNTNLLPGHFTCPSIFKPGTYSRANANIDNVPYLVLECDRVLGEPKNDNDKLLNKNASASIFKWLRRSVGLELRAIVDSGNKSLHSWWVRPSEEKLEELRIVLPQMGIDRASFKPAQPMRLAGLTRDNGNRQNLLWII